MCGVSFSVVDAQDHVKRLAGRIFSLGKRCGVFREMLDLIRRDKINSKPVKKVEYYCSIIKKLYQWLLSSSFMGDHFKQKIIYGWLKW